MQASDSELLRRARQDDPAAWRELMDRFVPMLYGLAFSLVGNAADAEDVVQETFAGAFRHVRSFRGQASVKTWLVGILVRQAARCYRARGRRQGVSLEELDQASWAALADRRAAAREASHDIRADVLDVLQSLPPEYREVVVLRELEGLSYEEIAGVLGVPRGTVESRLFRARQRLKEGLKSYLP